MRNSLLFALSSLLVGALSLPVSPAPAARDIDSDKLVYQFPKGVWIENLAVRQQGSILLAEITRPNLWLVDPSINNPEPTLVHAFPGFAVLGIAESTADTFYVVVSNLTLRTLSVEPGSNSIFRVSFPSAASTDPSVAQVATVGEAEFLNGLTALPNTDILLSADSFKGVIWAINSKTGSSHVASSDPILRPPPATSAIPNIGVNGVHIRGSTLYFTNSAGLIFAKMPINPVDGTQAGPAVVISHPPLGAEGQYDDFAIGPLGQYAFLATGGNNAIAQVSLHSGAQVEVIGNLNSTEVAEPTSAAFGRTLRDAGTLYVTTGGGLAIPVEGDETVGAQVLAVDTLFGL